MHALDGFEHLAFEALRLRPVVPFNGYESLHDIELGGLALPAQTLLFFIYRPSLTDPARFPDPQRYDPERWRHEGRHDMRAFLQFGAGPRVCPGRHLATVEMRLVLSMLLAHFEVELAIDPSRIEEVNAFTMMPSTMPVRLLGRRRSGLFAPRVLMLQPLPSARLVRPAPSSGRRSARPRDSRGRSLRHNED